MDSSAPRTPSSRRAPPTERLRSGANTLRQKTLVKLREAIVTGRFKPDERLVERDVCAKTGVSRSSVREALRLLEKDGLVTILARRGAQVTKLTIPEVKEIFDIRAALNGLRDRDIAEDPRRHELLPAIEATVKQLAVQARDTARGDEYAETVYRLNSLLNSATRSARLRSILGALAQQTLRYSRLGLSSEQRRRQSVRHWQELVRAIRDGDGESAQRTAERRVRDSRDAAIKKLEEAAGL